VSLADRLRDLLGKDDELEEKEQPDDTGDEEEDEDDPSVYPLW
jgi:hypothetical protein